MSPDEIRVGTTPATAPTSPKGTSRWPSGASTGESLRVTSVTSASVPSLPMISWVRS